MLSLPEKNAIDFYHQGTRGKILKKIQEIMAHIPGPGNCYDRLRLIVQQ